VLQRKLAVGASNDPLEQQADRVADQVVGGPAHRPSGGHEADVEATAPATVAEVLASPGAPLDAGVQAEMTQRFGHDFGQVRVHANDAAARSAQDVNALAYTVGQDIVFGARMFQPATTQGRRLIAHELTHVVQQTGSSAGVGSAAQPVVQRVIPDPTHRRHLTAAEVHEVQLVFGSALKTENVVISEGGLMTLGGYARTVPDRIYFPSDSFTIPLLIHELTHVWQYQRGEGWGQLPGMIWEAIVANYNYGGVDGLKEAWAKGTAFSEFTTEQQGDILQNYYERLKAHEDVTAYQPFVDDVRAGREGVHRYTPIEPLESGTLDVWKANREYRDKQEAELIRELRMPMSPNDPRAVARANRLLAFFGQTYWTEYYRERLVAQRSDDVLVQLLYSQLSPATQKRIFTVLGLDKGVRP
jgi:hypothetical protein